MQSIIAFKTYTNKRFYFIVWLFWPKRLSQYQCNNLEELIDGNLRHWSQGPIETDYFGIPRSWELMALVHTYGRSSQYTVNVMTQSNENGSCANNNSLSNFRLHLLPERCVSKLDHIKPLTWWYSMDLVFNDFIPRAVGGFGNHLLNETLPKATRALFQYRKKKSYFLQISWNLKPPWLDIKIIGSL